MEKPANKSATDQHGFGPLDAWLIDRYLRHADETLEEAKIRIRETMVRKSGQ